MKKQKLSKLLINVLFVLVSLMLAWYVLDSLLLAIAFAILIFLGIFLLSKKINQKNIKLKHIDDAYNFVNLMNVHMLSTKSVYEAYKSAENYLSVDFCGIDCDDLHSHLLEVSNNYGLNSFKMYVNTLIIYDTDGGNFKEMEQIPTSLCQKNKTYHHKLMSKKLSKLIGVSTLYSLWIIVICFLRTTISDYYTKMMENMTYQFAIFFILVAGSICYYMAYLDYLKIEIKGL